MSGVQVVQARMQSVKEQLEEGYSDPELRQQYYLEILRPWSQMQQKAELALAQYDPSSPSWHEAYRVWELLSQEIARLTGPDAFMGWYIKILRKQGLTEGARGW